MLRTRALKGSELWQLPQDRRNEAVFEQNRHRLLKDVRVEAAGVHQRLVVELVGWEDGDLVDPARFAGMPADWQPPEGDRRQQLLSSIETGGTTYRPGWRSMNDGL